MQVRPHEPVCSQSGLRAPHHLCGRGEVIGGIKRADAQLHGGRGSPACNLACTIATVRGRGDSPTPLQPLLFYPFALLHSTLRHFFRSAIFSGATQNPARVIMRVRKNNIEQSRSSSLWLNLFFSCVTSYDRITYVNSPLESETSVKLVLLKIDHSIHEMVFDA